MAETMIPMPGMEVEISVQGMQASRFEAIEAAEAAREAAEAAREAAFDANEAARAATFAAAESGRKTAETAREAAEKGRTLAEAARVDAESARETAESGRAGAEVERVKAETARGKAESARAAAEKARDDAETGREAAEAERQASFNANEAAREAEFEAAENDRTAAETARETAEAARETAEAERAAAEELRAEMFAGYESRLDGLDDAVGAKADQTSLAKTDRRLDALWKLNQGVSYQFETDDTEAYQKTVPSGAKLANIDSIGGHTEAVDGALVSAGVESVKYNDTVVADIPAAVRALPGYGWSAGSVHNGVERTETGWQYVQRIGSVDLGNCSYQYFNSTNYKGFVCLLQAASAKPKNNFNWILSAPYTRNTRGDYSITVKTDKSAGCIFYTSFIIRDDSFGEDAAAFKTAMSGVILYFELAELVITDISDLMGDELDVIPVEAGGTLTFENAAQLAVPNSVEYAVALAEVNG